LPPFASVQAAYDHAQGLLANPGTGLTPEQVAGITVTVDATDPGSGDVTEYTVRLRGDYKTTMRLGDLQRSAIKILGIVTQSADFKALADLQGVTGISVAPYAAQFGTLPSYVGLVSGAVVPKPAASTPKPTVPVPPPPAPTVTPSGSPLTGVTSQVASGGRVGTVVYASTNGWAAGTQLTYQWLRDGVAIPGANGASYTPTKDDRGKTLSVQITGTLNGTSGAHTVTVGKIAFGKIKTARPKLTGTAKAGKTLKVKRGSWSKGIKVSYKWYRGGKVIKGAKSVSYKLKSADAGKTIRVKVTATKAGYSKVSRVSPRVSVKK
jgi:hypothetical protein